MATPDETNRSTGIGDDSFREAEAHFPDNQKGVRQLQDEKLHGVSQKQPEGTIRRRFALVGFFGGILFGLYLSLGDNTLGNAVQTILFSPVIGIFFAVVGAAIGNWTELAVRLVTRPRGKSLLLTLVGDEELPD